MPAQYGQPCPCTLAEMTACHSCPQGPSHQTFVRADDDTSDGARPSFFVGCHCFASSGWTVARLLTPLVSRPIRAPSLFSIPLCSKQEPAHQR